MARTGSSSKRSFLGGVVVALALLLASRFALPALEQTRCVNPSLLIWLFDGVPLQATYFPTPIKSITAIALSNGSPTQTVSVTAANSILLWNGLTTNQNPDPQGFAYGTITNGTTISLGGPNAGTTAWRGTLVEFLGNFVKSQGCSTITIAASTTSNTGTITSVNQNKTMLSMTGEQVTENGSNNNDSAFAKLVPTSSTVLTASVNTAVVPATVVVVGYCYLEFK